MKQKIKSRVLSFIIAAFFIMACSAGLADYKVYAASVGPELLITEIMPMSQSSDDLYEYFEIYNNSDINIDLKDYRLPNQNVDFTETTIIPAKGVLVVCTRSVTSLSDFNAFYGTSLTDENYITLPLVNEMMKNSTSGTIILTKDDGTVVVRAKYNTGDFSSKRSVIYKYPETGFDMYKLAKVQLPTPGDVYSEQIPENGISVTDVALNKYSLTMEVSQTAKLYATVTPVTATNKSVEWESDDTDVVEVDGNGVLTAKSEGEAIVTVTTVDGGFTASCEVHVKRVPVTGVTLGESKITLDVGEAVTLIATVYPEDATNKKVTWYSSNSSVAYVSTNGRVVGKSRGTAVITTKTVDGNFTASRIVEVENDDADIDVTGVSLNKEEVTLKEGKKIRLEARVRPYTATNKDVRWSSSDDDVATVDEDGIVSAEGEGYAMITVRTEDGGYTDSCLVTVTDDPDDNDITGLHLNKKLVVLQDGQSQKVIPIITPESAKYVKLNWTTSNSDVATVNSDGYITGNGHGFAIVTVTTEDGKYSDSCFVLVIDKKGHDNGNGKSKGNAYGHWKKLFWYK